MKSSSELKSSAPRAVFHRFVTVVFASASVDLEITWSAETTSVADLIETASQVAFDERRDNGFVALSVMVDGRVVATDTALERSGIATGSIIDCRTPGRGDKRLQEPIRLDGVMTQTAHPLRVDHIAGCDAGGHIEVPEDAELKLSHRDGSTISATLGMGELGMGKQGSGPDEYWTANDYVRVGTEVLAVVINDPRPPRSLASGSSDTPNGEPVVVNRPPRVVPRRRAEPPRRPQVPCRPADPPPLSWASLLAPIPIGIAMALLFRPYFLLFTAAGPVMFVGRWWEGRRRYRRACLEWQREVYDRSDEYRQQLQAMAKLGAVERRRSQPTICEIADRIERCARSLWERRPIHDDFAVIAVAYGDDSWPHATESLSGPTNPVTVAMVPLLVDLRRHHIVGVIGTRAAHNLCRAMICQLVGLHGPAHLRIGGGQSPSNEREWMKWLPHFVASNEDLSIPAEPDAISSSNSWTVRLFDVGVEPTTSSSIVVAPSPDDVPSTCSILIDCRDYEASSHRGRVEITDVEAGTTVVAHNIIGVSSSRAQTMARHLARYIDPEMATGSAALPEAIPLADLEGWYDPDPIVKAWHDAGGDDLTAAVGTTICSYEIDLVADGPHALVAGTTGSGKSELLRTWVTALAGRYSPRDCAFVLIDFKGGGAFDAVASLPHVAAVVTDLDEGLAQRGLRSLRAELRDREQRFRDHGVADIASYRRGGARDLPRLVVIIDEFATLAAELPAFLDGLVDIAQRGRSLGVHMVLATQRPAGVLDQKIRANTNLRICLRVQDSADSIDVIDVSDAASLPRNRPGRALVRKGADDVELIQCAHVGPSQTGPNQSLRYRRFDPHEPVPWRPVSDAQPGAVERVLAAARRCAGEELVAAPAAPWCAPLAATVNRADLWKQDPPHHLAIPIGIEDRPDERLQKVWYWDRSAGPLLVVGGSDGERRAVIASVIDGVGRSAAGTDTYVIHTEIGATPFGETGWPGAIGADHVERIDRILLRCAQTGPTLEPIVVIIERFDLLGSSASETDAAILRDHLERVITQSSRSVSFVIGGATERSIPSRVAAHAAQRLILRLADAGAYAAVGLRERTMPAITPMGAVDPRESTAVRLAGAEEEDYTALHFPRSEPVRTAPDLVTRSDLAADTLSVGLLIDGELALGIGLDLITQYPFLARLTPDEPFIVAGERRSGRTAALAAFIDGARHVPAQVGTAALGRVVIAGITRAASNYERWGPDLVVWSDNTPSFAERIGELTSPTLIVVDDGDRINDYEGAALAEAAGTGGHYLVVASTSDAMRSVRSWVSALRSARNGVVLGFARNDAEILRSTPLRFCGIEWQPGRGIAASQSEPTLMQLVASAAAVDTR